VGLSSPHTHRQRTRLRLTHRCIQIQNGHRKQNRMLFPLFTHRLTDNTQRNFKRCQFIATLNTLLVGNNLNIIIKVNHNVTFLVNTNLTHSTDKNNTTRLFIYNDLITFWGSTPRSRACQVDTPINNVRFPTPTHRHKCKKCQTLVVLCNYSPNERQEK